MFRLKHIQSLALLALLWPGNLRGGTLEKVWEVDLKKALKGEHLGARQSYRVEKLSFSPDGQQIVAHLGALGETKVLFRVQDQAVLGVFDGDIYGTFAWSPDSQIIYSGRHVVRLADKETCDLPRAVSPKFVGKDSLVALFVGTVPLTPDGKVDFNLQHRGPAHLRLFDLNCQEQDSWEVPSNWLIGDASPDRGLLSIPVIESTPWTTELIVNPFEKKILHKWTAQDAPRGRFEDHGKALCGRTCWDVDTGTRIVSGRPIRIVLDEGDKRQVWDFNSGKEVVSWKLNFITYSISLDLDGFNRDRRPFPCAISPDGEYIAEGSDGKIELSKIQP